MIKFGFIICGLLAQALFAGSPTDRKVEKQLEAAIHQEMVVGNLQGAIEQYKAILSQTETDRSIAARALFQMGLSQEKLGQRTAAREAYARVISQYGDQKEVAVQTQAKLASWSDAPVGPRNLNFEEGEAGKVPAGWLVPTPGSASEVRRQGCHSGRSCASVGAASDPPAYKFSNLMQSFSAAAYRGKTVRLRAVLRKEGGDPSDSAQMWLRVDRQNRQIGFFDNMDSRPVRSAEWTAAEIVGPIAEDATVINIGVFGLGTARAWIDEVSFQEVSSETPSTAPVVNRPAAPASPGFGVATATFPVQEAAGKTVRFRGFIKTEGVTRGWAGLWWRVDGAGVPKTLAFDNMQNRGVTGTTGWKQYEIVLPVAPEATNINFGALHTGDGMAWFDGLTVELDGVPYTDKSKFDLDFESPTPIGFYTGGSGYQVQLDPEAAISGKQSLRMKYVGGSTGSSTRGFGVATATFPVKDAAGKRVRFSGYIKTVGVTRDYAGLWWRADGQTGSIAFDNMAYHKDPGKNEMVKYDSCRGATGTSAWKRYSIELLVPPETTNINFGALFPGDGTAWFDDLTVEIDGVAYLDKSVFDLDFESPTPKGFYTGGNGYKVQLDNEVVYKGKQSLRMEYVGIAK